MALDADEDELLSGGVAGRERIDWAYYKNVLPKTGKTVPNCDATRRLPLRVISLAGADLHNIYPGRAPLLYIELPRLDSPGHQAFFQRREHGPYATVIWRTEFPSRRP